MKPLRLLPILALTASPLAAHHYALSLGILHVEGKVVKLHLRLFTHDLHPALEAFAGHRIVLKDGEGYDPVLMTAYFKGRLELVGADGKARPFRVATLKGDAKEWIVDCEADLQGAETDLAGLSLHHEVLMEKVPKQKNLVTVEGLGARKGLTFDAKHPLLPLEGVKP